MQLPREFIARYEDLLGEEAAAFLASFEEEPVAGFRTNPLKETQPVYDQPQPGLPWSFYGKQSGKSIAHVTGLVYSQEPAAQMVGWVAAPRQGMKVLDLAAAPGGKTTHLLSYLGNQGLLVSNEISSKRAKILVENVERFGARNVLVTNESAERLATVFPSYFDMIVLDAPCSGEGMFRKDPAAIQYWSTDYPEQCALLQREILKAALTMLAPGGQLVYSTCTWSKEENEDIVSWLLETGDVRLLDIPKINGMQPGIGFPETARMYPHHFRGEGQFVAKCVYQGEGRKAKFRPAKSALKPEQQQLWTAFCTSYLKTNLEGVLQVFGDHLYLLPHGLPDLSSLRIARNGLHLGVFKKKRFEPSFALGVALHSSEVRYRVDLSEEEFRIYVSGHPLSLSKELENGWYQVAAGGNGLGFAKLVDGTLKNNFPKGLRFQS